MKTKNLRSEVTEAARLAEEAAAIQTHLGGGMHPKSSQLWAYFLALQNTYGISGDLMEIGVFKGWGAYLPAKYCRPDERLLLVDIAIHFLQEAKAFLIERTGIQASGLELVQVDSVFTEGLSRALGASRRLRFIHIDGEHLYAAVVADLDSAARFALPESIIVVDDVDLAHSTCINDGLHDWLARNSSWRLLIRGYNKAYIVSTRSRIPWKRHVDFLPEVFRRYFRTEVMIASQTHNPESDYLAIGDPVAGNSYQMVSRTMSALETFEGYNPRASLLGQSNRALIALCGDDQMMVLAGALTSAAAACGIDASFEYVGTLAAVRAGSDDALQVRMQAAAGLIAQQGAADQPPLTAADTTRLYGLGWVVDVPHLHFDGYWPNRLPLRLTGDSEVGTDADAVIWTGVENEQGNDAILGRLADLGLYAPSAVREHAQRALDALRLQEQRFPAAAGLADLVNTGLESGGRRLFHAPDRPCRRLMDALLAAVLRELTQVFEPRHRDRLQQIMDGSHVPVYDMSSLARVDEVPLPSVAAALGLKLEPADAGICRYVLRSADDAVHARVSWQEDIDTLRQHAAHLDAQAREANARSIAARAPFVR